MSILLLALACVTDPGTDTAGGGAGGVGHDGDKAAPELAWVAPTAGATVSGVVPLELSAEDAGSGVATVSLTVDGVAFAQLTAPPWVASVDSTTLPNGEHDLVAVATDAAGNEAEALLRVLVLNDGPSPDSVQFLSPTGEGALCGQVPIEVYTTTPASSVTLFIDGSEKAADAAPPYYWSWDSTGRDDGEHILAAVATFPDGTQVSDRLTVEVGNGRAKCVPLPSVRIMAPDPGDLLGSSTEVTVESAAGELRLIRLDVDGVELHSWNAAPYTFTWDTADLSEGAHVLGATAYDTADQTTRTQNLVYVDTTAPRARITSPAFDSILHGEVLVTGDVSDASGIASARLYADGRLVGGLSAEPWEWTWDADNAEGEVELELLVTDMVGRTASDSVTVYADQLPDVHSTSPLDGDTVSGIVSLAVSASDDQGLVEVQWLLDGAALDADTTSPYRGAWDTCADPGGAHTLVARAIDSRDQTAEATLSVTVDQPQQVEHDSPSGLLDPTQTVRSWIVDDETTTEVTWSIDGVEVASSTAGSPDVDCPVDCVDLCLAFQAELDVSAVADGAHVLTISATNAVGDRTSLDVDVEIDRDLDDDGVDAESWGGADCDDTDAAVSPDVPERCDGADQDCDGLADEDFDADGDTFYSADACTTGDDCDDTDADVSPLGTEVCDGVDNDCDDAVDASGLATTDSDTVATGTLTATTSGELWGDVVTADRDVTLTSFEARLDPGSGTVWFGVYEADSPTGDFALVASNVRSLSGAAGWYSSGSLDVELTTGKSYLLGVSSASSLGYLYERGASLASTGTVTPEGWLKHTAAAEPSTVSDDPSTAALFGLVVHVEWTEATDLDTDLDGETPFCGDCDDSDAERATTVAESCDGVDNDCDGALPADEADADADGDRVCDGDCDDTDADRAPSAWESCDGIDNDCDGVVGADETDQDGDGVAPCVDSAGLADCDDTDASTLSATFYTDADGDGRGLASTATTACPPPAGAVRLGGDCDDGDDQASPDLAETCDGVDNDCDGVVDDGFDGDSDGTPSCEDCDDGDAAVNPDATEVCGNAVDEDCDGVAPACRWSGSVDPTTAGHYLLAETASSSSGHALAAGDLDGDGVDEIAVGAYGSSAGPSSGGAVYVVSGPLSGDVFLGTTTADRLLAESSSDALGYAVSLPDLDGDGLAELVTGASGDDDGGSNAGAIYLVAPGALTSATVSSVADKITGGTAGDAFGQYVSSPGDVDGDGHADVLVGATAQDSGGSSAGAVYVFSNPAGAGSAPTLADAMLVGERAGDAAGSSLGRGGDFDGDGLADLVVGAPTEDSGGTSAGAVYLLSGASGTVDLSAADVKFLGGAASDQLGSAPVVGADIDGDGWDDAVLAAPRATGSASTSGVVYVFFGPIVADATATDADAVRYGVGSDDRVGSAMTCPGDLDGDGAEDLLVGAPYADDAGVDGGLVYLLYGGFAGSDTLDGADATWLAESAGDTMGLAVVAGEVDGDGVTDLLLAAPASDLFVSNGGAVYVFGGEP